ncbi:pyrimidine dimer DNA glycosylase [Shewanella sp. phage 1/40]|uniref:endonuclease V N-glycosylase UV repair enzyme n=1 Tax=Shewanella sp. phage 1/40 TaxID=1458860 RepID=UPI0004F828C9|nr:endonuclease V N-glycosylase UV repair enzyme [Shewanella sp. phage 1/40]AHK11617.1 pyrimidine dimer DNA glycosylase [Shewanella sp. phage 1/40]
MTRINTVNPSDLTNEWLLAEFTELLRIPNKILSGKTKLDKNRIPASFRMGTGHEIFFHDKLKWLHDRHNAITKECLSRGININTNFKFNYDSLPQVVKLFYYNDWKPSQADHGILIERLQERFDLRKKAYHVTFEGVKHKIDCDHSFNWYCEKFLSKYF